MGELSSSRCAVQVAFARVVDSFVFALLAAEYGSVAFPWNICCEITPFGFHPSPLSHFFKLFIASVSAARNRSHSKQ